MLMTLWFFFKDGSVWRTNKFTDVSQFPIADSSADMRVWERRLLYCVPVSYLYSQFLFFWWSASIFNPKTFKHITKCVVLELLF